MSNDRLHISNSVFVSDSILNALSAKGRGYIEAALKISEGQRLINEGTLEMRHLDGAKNRKNKYNSAPGGRVTRPASAPAKKEKKARRVAANKTATKRKAARAPAESKPADLALFEKDKNRIVALLKETPNLSIGKLMRKLKRSFYPVQRAIKALVEEKRLVESSVKSGSRTVQTWVPA